MSATDSIPASIERTTTSDEADIDTIGIEFEYPVSPHRDGEMIPGNGDRSRGLRDNVGTTNDWHLDIDVPTGEMTSDHVGAEITSAPLDLHSRDPERWYAATIDRATDMGYPFATTGYGETVFGLHMHLSEVPREKAEALYELCQEPWMRLFVCTSLSESSLDPWRHGGVSDAGLCGDRSFSSQRVVNEVTFQSGDNRYEWRLPEPMAPDHLSVVMHFLRVLESEGIDAARDYAYELVHERDPRLTAVKQYRHLSESHDDWPYSTTVGEDTSTDPFVAEYVRDLFE